MSRRRHRRDRVITQPVAHLPSPGAVEPVYTGRRPGRPQKLTREIRDRFMQALRAGAYRHSAALLVGISPHTVESWMRRGRGQLKDRPPYPEYVEFVRMVEEAEAQAYVSVQGNLFARSRFDHNAALAWLRTRYPADWPRFPGEEEGETPFGQPMPQPPQVTVERVTERNNLVFLPLEAFDEATHRLLEQRRQERRAEPVEIEEEPAPEAGPAHDTRTRRAGLRLEAADTVAG